MERIHGGDLTGYEERYGRKPIDFSASTGPLGIPEGVRAAAAASLAGADRYPDPMCRALRRAISERMGPAPEEILCGSGASDLLDRLAAALRPRRALLPVPSFGEYRAVLERAGCMIRTVLLPEAEDLRLGAWFAETITADLDAVILCEPNNPTGLLTDRALLTKIADRCDALGVLLVADESFLAFVEDAEERSLLPEIGRHHLLVLRSFTKFYGMAGLRLGWCACADRGLLRRMAAVGQPWPVSVPAQAAGLAALKETAYARQVRELVRRERPRLRAALEAAGCRVIPGEANYLLFRDALPGLGARLAERGLLVRCCADFEGLGPDWYRIAVRSRPENDMLIRAMEEVHR